MRIALVSSLFPPYAIGGAEQMAAGLARALARLGQEVEILSTCPRRDVGRAGYRVDMWEGMRVWRVAPLNLYWRFEKETAHPGRLARAAWHAVDLWNPSLFGALPKVFEKMRPEVVNTHNIDGFSPAVWQVARNYSRATYHTLHDYHLLCPRATLRRANGTACEGLCGFCSLYARYHRCFAGQVRALVAPSESIAAVHLRAGWPDVRIVRNAVDVEAPRVREPEASEPLRAVFMSRLEREKGCETLRSIVPRCEGVEFHVAGRGPYEERFRRLPGNVIWHGFVTGERKRALLSKGDVFLQLSECRENAPLGLLEAKRFGLFLVGTEIGGIPEQIDGAGVLIPPANPERLLEVLNDLSERKQAIREGRNTRIRGAAEGYGTREMAGEYLRLFRST